MSAIMFYFGWCVFALWLVSLTPSLIAVASRSLDAAARRSATPTDWPRISLIVPARNEERRIDAAMRSKLAVDYPNLEVIAIDDRSQDATGAILDKLAAEDPRLQVVHVERLPEGWLGKCHALQSAAQAATGKYLIFTDADVFFDHQVLRKAAAYCEAKEIDHLTLMPKLETNGLLESALHTYFALLLFMSAQPWLVRTNFRLSYVGVGAFNLVRKSAYEACGGHEPIRLDVLDDVKLGKMMKHNGHKQDVLTATNGISVRWQESFWGVIRGLEKNGFAVFNYSFTRLIVGTLVMGTVSLLPYFAILGLPWPVSSGFWASVVLMHAAALIPTAMFGFRAISVIALPVAAMALIYTMWRSAWMTWRQRGVQWRDTFYPLTLLKENLY